MSRFLKILLAITVVTHVPVWLAVAQLGHLLSWPHPFVLGGAFGNLYDRTVHGTVTDFVEVYAGTHFFPAFNVADSAITVGAGLLLLDMWRGRKRVASEVGAR